MLRDFDAAKRTAAQLKERHAALTQQQQRLRSQLQQTSVPLKGMAQHQADLHKRIDAATGTLKRQNAELERQGQRMKRAASAHDQYDRTMSLRNKLAGTGAAAMATGSGALYGMKRFIDPGVSFDKTMSRVQALTRLEKGDTQLAELRTLARQLGADTQFSATDAASGMAFLGMAGFTPEAIKAAMPGLLDMALAGDVELGRTADIASNILGGFGLEASEMGKVADVLTTAFTTSNTSLEMLGSTMAKVAPVAKTAGMSLEETAAMAGLLGNIGIQSERAGTVLQNMLSNLSDPKGAGQKALKKLGIKPTDRKGELRDILTLLDETAKKTAKMGSGDRLKYISQIFGREAAAGMAELIAQSGEDGIRKYLAIIQDYEGAASRTAKVMADNLSGDLDELSSAFEEVRISIFDMNDGALRGLTKSVTDVVRRVGKWIKANPRLASILAKTAAIGATVVAVFGALTLALAALLGPFAMIKLGMAMMSTSILPMISGAFAKVFMIINKHPFAMLLLGLMGFINYAVQNWGRLVELFKSGDWAGIGIWILQGLEAGLNMMTAGLYNAIKNLVIGFIDFVHSLLGIHSPSTVFADIGRNLILGLINGVSGTIGHAATKFLEFGSNLMTSFAEGIRSKFAAVKQAVENVSDSITSRLKRKLRINSPSKVFAQIGASTMLGLSQGVVAAENMPLMAVDDVAQQIIATTRQGLQAIGEYFHNASTVQIDSRPPLSGGAATAGGNVTHNYTITINPAPGMDEQALARLVERVIEQRERTSTARQRSRLGDLE